MFEKIYMNVIGVYKYNEDTVLVELAIDELSTNIRFNHFFLYEKNVESSDSQAPYLEQFLSEDGVDRISDIYGEMEQVVKPSRLAFFMFFVSEGSIIKTPYGDIKVKEIKPLPKRLRKVIEFVEVD